MKMGWSTALLVVTGEKLLLELPLLELVCWLMLSSPAIVAAAVSPYSVTITTQPRQGPFRKGQRVQFSCSVQPTPPGNLTYQWRMVEFADITFVLARQHFRRMYTNRYLHYCYYYCEVSANGTVVGSTSRIVEALGKWKPLPFSLFKVFCVCRLFVSCGACGAGFFARWQYIAECECNEYLLWLFLHQFPGMVSQWNWNQLWREWADDHW